MRFVLIILMITMLLSCKDDMAGRLKGGTIITVKGDTIAYRNVENVYECLKMFTNTCLIDAAYEILCWCIEYGYIKELKNE